MERDGFGSILINVGAFGLIWILVLFVQDALVCIDTGSYFVIMASIVSLFFAGLVLATAPLNQKRTIFAATAIVFCTIIGFVLCLATRSCTTNGPVWTCFGIMAGFNLAAGVIRSCATNTPYQEIA